MFNEWDLGWPLNRPQQPVVRVSQQDAEALLAEVTDYARDRLLPDMTAVSADTGFRKKKGGSGSKSCRESDSISRACAA